MASLERPPRSARRRTAVAALALLGLALAPPATAQVTARPPGLSAKPARPLALYPVTGRGEMDADAADVQSLLDAALYRVAQRSPDVTVRDPLLLRATCGPSRTASAECLGQLAGAGMVVRAAVRRVGNALVVAVEAVDGAAQVQGPVSVAIDAYVQSAEPFANAVLLLIDRAIVAERRRAQEPRRATPRPPVVAARPSAAPAVAPAPPPPAPAPAASERAATPKVDPAAKPDLAARAPAPPKGALAGLREERAPRNWKRPVGKWMTGAGVALLAGGIAMSVVNRTESDELERRFSAGTLTAGDLARYDRVDRTNTLTAALLASGGAFTLAGMALWTAPPPRGGGVVGVSGRF